MDKQILMKDLVGVRVGVVETLTDTTVFSNAILCVDEFGYYVNGYYISSIDCFNVEKIVVWSDAIYIHVYQ